MKDRMEDILKAFYHGRLYPQEDAPPSSEELMQEMSRFSLLENQLLETMDDVQRAAMTQLTEAWNAASAAEIERAYIPRHAHGRTADRGAAGR